MRYWEARWRWYCPNGGHLNFFGADTKKCQKNSFFAFGKFSWDFDILGYIQGTTMWKLPSSRFRKCIKNWSGELHTGELHTGSYNPSKMEESEKTGPSQKIRHRETTLHQFWKLGSETNSSCKQPHRPLILFVSASKHQNWRSVIFSRCPPIMGIPSIIFLEIWLDFDSQ